jgi:DNA-directed RNA polymerase specialized sigma24 family protein
MMRADPGALYDAHAARLYAYCWSLVGDRAAADAVTSTFVATVRHPPRGDTVLWLYALARSACMELGALDGLPDGAFRSRPASARPASPGDPLLRAAAGLRADHREVLLLWAGGWLEIDDIARVVGVAPDTARGLLHAARTRLERAVLDALMRAPAHTPAHLELIGAFEKGGLPRLLARRVPDRPPRELRERVLAACEVEARRTLPTVTAGGPLVVIGGAAGPEPTSPDAGRSKARKKARKVGAAASLAAAAAAAVGMLISWPVGKGGGSAKLVPTSGSDRAEAGSARPSDGSSGGASDAARSGGLSTGPLTQSSRPAAPSWAGTGASGAPPGRGGGTPSGGGGSSAAPGEKRRATGRPAAPGSTSPGAPTPTASSPTRTPTGTATPADPAPEAPTSPSSPPPAASPDPSAAPAPTSNPAPSPSED